MADNTNGRRTYTTYRLGDVTQERLAQVLDFHQGHYGTPAGLVVNVTILEPVTSALAALGASWPVTTCGGCLAWEVWVERDTSSLGAGPVIRPKMLTARVTDAQRAGDRMTPAEARERLEEQLTLGLEEV